MQTFVNIKARTLCMFCNISEVYRFFLDTGTRLYTLPCRLICRSVTNIFELQAAPAQPFTTVLPCIRPCLFLSLSVSRFLVANTQLYKRICPSIHPSVRKHESKSGKTHISAPAHPSATDGRVSGLVSFCFCFCFFFSLHVFWSDYLFIYLLGFVQMSIFLSS